VELCLEMWCAGEGGGQGMGDMVGHMRLGIWQGEGEGEGA
jgi:hypothetical protein